MKIEVSITTLTFLGASGENGKGGTWSDSETLKHSGVAKVCLWWPGRCPQFLTVSWSTSKHPEFI